MSPASSRLARMLLLAGACFTAGDAAAHAMNSAHWRLTQLDAQTWHSRLRLPEDFEGRLLSLQPQWPAGCTRSGEPQLLPAEEGTVFAWRLHCPKGLQGNLGLTGFSLQLPDAVLQLQPLHGAEQHAVLSSTRPQWTPGVQAEPPPVAHYLPLGIRHILLGPDHLLFVLGLWALWRRSGRGLGALVGVLTAFTIAHSLTLAGAILGGWRLPVAAVEACIAGSILLLAIELASREPGIAGRRPAGVAFGFGLLHGLGFAGALAATGLPEAARIWALLAFNLGVEIGQVAFVLVLTLLAARTQPLQRWAPAALSVYGAVAAWWLLERSAVVLS